MPDRIQSRAINDAALSVIGIVRAFGRKEVLRDINLNVAPGEITAVLGPSGGGKTTFLRIVAGFLRADAGTVALAGAVVDGPGRWTPPEQRRVGIVPQEGALFPHLSVAANVAFGLPRGRGRDRVERVAECLALVGLPDHGKARPHELSGGQQQRVAVARALAPRPAVVMLDEPFSSLDAGLRTQVRTEVLAALRATGATAVLVTHDQQEALSAADRVAVLLGGQFRQVSDPVTIYRAPATLDVARFVGEVVIVPGHRNGTGITTPLGNVQARDSNSPDGELVIVIRPEQLQIGPAPGAVRARVIRTTFEGADTLIELAIQNLSTPVLARTRITPSPRAGDDVDVHITGAVCAFPTGQER